MTAPHDTIGDAAYAAIRYGYGYSKRPIPRSADQLLARLATGDVMADRFRTMPFDETRVLLDEFIAARSIREESAENEKAYQAVRGRIRQAESQQMLRAFARITDTEDPFRERLVWFWADHFTARAKSLPNHPGTMSYVDAAIRPNITARFADILQAAVLHPVMLLYLDQNISYGPNSVAGLRHGRGLNENLAREILELHTLGVSASYTQTDVTEFADLLTGLTYNRTNGWHFSMALAEPGAEYVLGNAYGSDDAPQRGDIVQALEDIAMRPETAAHVCTKLARHFVAEDPDYNMVSSMIAAWRATAGDLMAVYEAMLAHPAAWSGFGAKVKLPFDYLASALVALHVRGYDIVRLERTPIQSLLYGPLVRMGQPFLLPRGPDGWPEGEADWITPQGIAERITWAMRAPKALVEPLPAPRRFVTTALGDVASARTVFAATAAETRQDGIGLVLASPEFNRR